MISSGVAVDEVTLTNVVGACARAGKLEDVLQAFDKFKKLGVHPNVVTYLTNNVINICF